MTTYTTRPLSDRTWFRPPAKRERTRFQAKWSQTLRRAQRAAHPDTGGSVELWASYEAAAAAVVSS